VIFERDDVQNQIAQVRVGSPEKRLGAACAFLESNPDYRQTNDFSQPVGDVFGRFLVGDRKAEWRSNH
jgi:hypothetical protein